MSNTLTGLIPDLQKAADIIGRERTGFITSAQLNTGSEAAAVGQTIDSFATQEPTEESVTPSMTIPEGTDQTVDNPTLTISNSTSVKIPWKGEQVRGLNTATGYRWSSVYGDQILQAIRKIVNTIEAYAAGVAYKNAGNAYGTSGTTPFGSNFNEIANVRNILADRGCPVDDGMVSMILGGTAGVNLRNLAQLQKANEAGGDDLLRRGTLLDLQGMMLKESQQVQTHTKGTGALYDVDLGAGYTAGDKTIHVDTGTGTFVQGDVITFSGHSRKYVVGTGFAGDGDGDIVLNSGVFEAVADNEDVAFENSYTANVALHRDAMEIVVRPYAKPEGGDAAVDEIIISDPFTGLSFLISDYRGYKKALFEIAVVYDAKVWKPDFLAVLQG